MVGKKLRNGVTMRAERKREMTEIIAAKSGGDKMAEFIASLATIVALVA